MPSVLILGGASCVFADASAAQAMHRFDAVMAVNDMIAAWPGPIDYAVTLHVEKLEVWLNDRVRRGHPGNPAVIVFANSVNRGKAPPGAKITREDWAGSSGLFAVKTSIGEGFDRIVCAGVPMDPAGAHFFSTDQWTDANDFRMGWSRNVERFASVTRSMSGWTKELLGCPTKAWLAG